MPSYASIVSCFPDVVSSHSDASDTITTAEHIVHALASKDRQHFKDHVRKILNEMARKKEWVQPTANIHFRCNMSLELSMHFDDKN